MSPFPSCVAFATATIWDWDFLGRHPDEESLLPRDAAPARRLTFSLGREAARRALTKLSGERRPVLRNANGSPRWPNGFLGTISHTDVLAAAAIARVDHTAGLGLDVEDLRHDISETIIPSIADDRESRWISNDRERLIRLFSAKEALFKAFSADVGIFFGFDSAHLDWVGDGFLATLSVERTNDAIVSRCVVTSQRVGNFVISSIFRPRLIETVLVAPPKSSG